MVYKKNFVASIKANGKILREKEDKVFIPFGTEYSIILKNLNTVKAKVTIAIDGQNIADNYNFIINPNQTAEVTRFIKNGNLNEGNRLKFIERSERIEQHRGINLEDGLIQIQYQFEQQPISITPSVHHHHYHHNTFLGGPLTWPSTPGIFYRGMATTSVDCISSSNASYSSVTPGITVPGSISDQKFDISPSIQVESEIHSIILQLVGQIEGKVVENAITVNHKNKCNICGKINKVTAKYCTECGASLQLF